MKSETMMEKGELIAQVQEKIMTTTIKEATPFGVKLELNVAGQVAGTLYNGQHIETINLYQKPDGTFEGEARAIETTPEGDVLVILFKGTGRPTGPTTVASSSQALIMTQSKRLAQLNNTWIRVEVAANLASGEVQLKYYGM
jgi:hypothetical protein